ncbi:MAG: hypothetical protein AB8B65_13485 [Kordia sp.]|uniref:hypothetical protein n=1 Tax=Kordia sp. TaxID=1965332 RepID=UPI00385C4CF7
MKKQIKKLNLRKNVIGNLANVSGGRPPKTWRYCDGPSGDGDDGTSGYTSFCSVIAC